jgi:hypothetical protein
MLPSYIKIESDNPMKIKLIVQKFIYENSFYFLNEYFELQKVKFIYIWYKLIFEILCLIFCAS